LTGDVASFVIIALVVGLSVTLDFVQEYRAGQAAERLKQSVALRATIVRDGKPQETTADRIVPGDVVQLHLGGMVPADGRVLESRDFFVNQALLTGEPYPIEKSPGDPGDKPVDLAAAANAVFMGTRSRELLPFSSAGPAATRRSAGSPTAWPPSRRPRRSRPACAGSASSFSDSRSSWWVSSSP
jgi:magnesium-transporting ATPase (P-type)